MASREIFRITDLSGGLNPDQNEVLIADNEASEILNFRLDKVGSLVSRHGYTLYISTANAADMFAIGRWSSGVPGSAAKVVIATNAGKLQVANLSGDSYDDIHTGLSTTAEGMFLPAQNFLAYANGDDTPVVYDGTDVETLGISAPAVAPTLGTPGAGTLNGTYQYVYTYADTTTGWESSASPARTASPSTESVVLNLVASAHGFVDAINIYRTEASGAVFLFLAQVAAATASYEDTGAVTLGILTAPTNNDMAPALENLAYHKGYMFGSIGNTLYWSKPLNIGAWPVLNSTEVPFEGNDTIVALKSFQDTLIIFGLKNTILLAGDGGNWALIRQDVEIGCTSRQAIAEVENSLVFLSSQGLYTFPGLQQYAPKLNRALCDPSTACRRSASMVYVPEERSIWLAMDDHTWVVHLLNQGISRYNFYAKAFLDDGDDGTSSPLWIEAASSAATAHKNLYQYGGATDNGAAIPLKWKSKVFQLSNPEFVKFVRRVGAYSTKGGSAAVTLTLSDSLQSHTVTLDATDQSTLSEWDAFDWDDDSWSGEGVSYFIGALPAHTLIGRVLQVTADALVSTETELISPISVEYRESDRFLGV